MSEKLPESATTTNTTSSSLVPPLSISHNYSDDHHQSRLPTYNHHDDYHQSQVSIWNNQKKWLRDLLHFLRPAILTSSPRRKLATTSYLDGLRGWAAFMVYWQHHQVWARVGISAEYIFENGWGFEGRHYFCALPFVRSLFTGGHFAVAIFFVISGRVLSAKSISLIHAGDQLKLGESLASALFRRWLRLFLPCIMSTFLYMTMWHIFDIWTAYPQHQPTWVDELWNWYVEFKNFSFVFRSLGPNSPPWLTYNFHLWSIPVEFRGSILIYTTLLALSRCTKNARLLIMSALILYFVYIVDGAHYAMFMAGMLLSDLDLLQRNSKLPAFIQTVREVAAPYQPALWYTLFVASMYLGGVPSLHSDIPSLSRNPGWYYLSFLKPDSIVDPKWFYLFWAAFGIVAAIPNLPGIKAFFETRFCQYLGRISFALYLVHGPVLWTLSDRAYLAAGWTREFNVDGIKSWQNIYPIPRIGPLGLELSFWVPHLVILPVTLWLAEMATKLFDENSVRIAQWAYQRALGGSS